uniref:Uncharacterized protein n=1 Tax=Arundo donax TaxID=35708 RepID=A0A0A9EIU7_ARUDO
MCNSDLWNFLFSCSREMLQANCCCCG